jgi:exodeoxyribonuclease VII small subunit
MNEEATNEAGQAREPDFESALEELESLVEALESGELGLADSLDRFKRGVELSRRCHQMLDQARQTVEKLSEPDDEGSAAPFEDDAAER